MIAPDLRDRHRKRCSELVAQAKVVLPFTGAGISTECGIPDFRSPGGLVDQEPAASRYDEFLASKEMRDESWRRRFAMEDTVRGARPGRGHLALASLYRAGKAPAVITQNIDNLHQCSGIAPETRGRAARQQHLCAVPGLRAALRARLGPGQFAAPADRRRTARIAVDRSSPRPFHSARPMPERPCGAPRN